MSFESAKPFQDFAHFPRGLRRCGEFTVAEAQLLEAAGHAMLALYTQQRAPGCDEEQRFVEQIQQGSASDSKHAKVWLKYLKVIGPKRVHRLCSPMTSGNGDDDYEPVEDSAE
ncbi:hypothetical protein GCM10011502_19730 [Oceanisphaera marina]|uniref:Macrodomain Ori protein n=1 Tax=Oceanisphaera marina TaxID=2017550 RepID=A0ABQ1IM22_9GAMM|nr:DUF413 domain-containing protein [Oceanisphaera marina]GGB46402.1 hypothetical protein GCM10011502_19730 [Oceanisphaera marina]